MKQFKFQNKASVIRGIKEEKPRKRKNWDRLIYLAIFILLLLSLFIYILRKNLYAYSLGEVITERFEVTRPDDIQVIKEVDILKKSIQMEITNHCVVLLMSSGNFGGMILEDLMQ